MVSSLPVDQVIPDLRSALQQSNTVLLSAAPGAGKTTRVPLALLNEPWLAGQRIIMLEPRRLAARNAARFMARQLGEAAGQTVGYRIRLETCVGPATRIEVVTEGILTRMLQSDPELTGVGLVIFDEFHERNLNSDLALALAHQCQQLLRDDLRLLIMSATLDEQALTDALQAPLLVSEGRSFPVDVQYRPLPNRNTKITDHCARTVREALKHDGDVLVFLPGVREITLVAALLSDLPASIQVLPLHGQLNDAEQKAALTSAPADQRKVILATNIAESSLTIDGVRVVVDSGLERRNVFHVGSGLNELKTRPISRASATQRAGRAGRQGPGVCYRLWPESTHERLDAHIRAEILDADLAPLVLELKQWGAEPGELFWLTPPPAAALQQAQDLLLQLGLLQPDTLALNEHGRACAALGIEPRWAHALLCLHALQHGKPACDWVALVQEWPASRRDTDDIIRLFRRAQQNRGVWQQRVAPLAQRLWQTLQTTTPAVPATRLQPDDIPALLLALAFPDRIAKRRDNSERFLLSNGRGAELLPQSDLLNANWLACADFSIGHSTRIRLAAELSDHALTALQSLAPQLFHQRTEIGFQDNGQFVARRHRQLGRISLSSAALPQLSADDWQQAWADYVQQQGLGCLPWPEDARQLRARLALAHQYEGQDWPDVSDDALLKRLSDWLLPFLISARHRRDLDKTDTQAALLSLLNWEQQQQLNALLPTTFTVPSGSAVALDYDQQPPVLAVKLQEMFGYEGQPTVLRGKLPLLIHLLSPARRPLQVTADLPHFWRHTYAEVRKDMRGRYPKHPWPEDPLSAEATRLTKNALARQKAE
ncbi:ATP-dependent helicase HrpB [Venatoribacter cucullus]|uniref:ATP-dependent helicase HrpB n=1 Tax=Venatoribacter cucullus TaxID=2661630 RepID=A0A9X7UYW6_9GAMM|nr:ATP-dependent helicase HrpB [Venatoribacter cucullus]